MNKDDIRYELFFEYILFPNQEELLEFESHPSAYAYKDRVGN